MFYCRFFVKDDANYPCQSHPCLQNPSTSVKSWFLLTLALWENTHASEEEIKHLEITTVC